MGLLKVVFLLCGLLRGSAASENIRHAKTINYISAGNGVFKNFIILTAYNNTFQARSSFVCPANCGRSTGCIGCSYQNTTSMCLISMVPWYGIMQAKTGWISTIKPYYKVIHLIATSKYTLDFQAAVDICNSVGSTIADYQDLVESQVIGYQTCMCGWVSDNYSYVVNQYSSQLCGSSGVSRCTWQSLWNVYCKLL